MSPLPQRKKTAEEIQQLRDQLRIPSPPLETITPVVTETDTIPLATPAPEAEILEPIPTATPARIPHRSFKRSEWETNPRTPLPPINPDSPLPARKHSRAEIEEIRRREVLANFTTEAPPGIFPKPASPFVIAPGYLLAASSLAWLYWKQIPLEIIAGLGTLALSVAAWILAFRPVSRHHSGFIFAITLLALTFAALHYFPHLKHAP